MANDLHENTLNKSQGNMALTEPNYPTTTSPGYPIKAEAQEYDLK